MKNQRVRALPSAAMAVVSIPPALLAGPAAGQVQPSAAMLRYPDVGKDSICFVYANDIWLVPKTGGTAAPLASPPGAELFPRFSPDGETIAFIGNYEGNRDLYTIPRAGGIPTRVTHHPGSETLSEWTPDGELLYITNAFAGLARQSQIYSVAAAGGLPSKLPVPYGAFGAISPDGTWLAYTPHSTDNRTWKRYRGGMATDVWLFNLKDNTSRRVTDWEGTDTLPMFVPGGDGRTVYFLSDAGPEHRLNIWAYDIASQKKEQVTKHAEFDVRWPSIGPGAGNKGEIVFQLGSEMRLLDLGSRKDSVVRVTIPGDRPTIKPRQVDASKTINAAAISPSGKRVIIEGRGDLWSAPAKEGVVRNLTRTGGVFERDPAWSPDGRWIAYFSDESGEYELWVRQSDAKPAERKEEEKKDGEKKEGEGKGDAETAEQGQTEKPEQPAPAKVEPRKVTNLGPGFRMAIVWSPDSKSLTFTDDAGDLHLCTVESGETKVIDTDPWSGGLVPSWSSDSRWLAYARADEGTNNGCVWLYDTRDGSKTRVTAPMFNSSGPTFDRKGDFLYFRSNRAVTAPVYSDMDTTFVYTGTQQMFMVPLREDVKNPFAVKSDEEEIKEDGKKGDDAKDEKKDEKKDDAKPADSGVSGTWEGKATGQGEGFPAEGVPFTLSISVADDGTVTGSVTSAMGSGGVTSGKYDKSSGRIEMTFTIGEKVITMTGTLKAGEASGTWTASDGAAGEWSCKRTAGEAGGADGDKKDDGDKADKDKPKEVKIDLDGFERRAILLPLTAGAFGDVGVTHDHKLIYVRQPARGSKDEAAIKIFDLEDEKKEEKAVANGGGFSLSADGKKLMVRAGSAMTVYEASAGGGKSTTVPTAGMTATVNPRDEWKQIFGDVYRFERDYFYEPTLHGVDWAGLKGHYAKMLEDCVSREDVAFVLAEYISELNVGHAYVTNPGDVEQAPTVPGGLLGCDFELVTSEGGGGAYQISAIYEGAPWDADARGPLSQPGINVKAGDYFLAVNGVPVDTAKDPWAALVGTANRPTSIRVGPNPAIVEESRELIVKPLESEVGLRFRAWIERNRSYVAERTSGRVGYAYVPNTGTDGQNELFRQFYGQRDRDGMIIDERWNGGGQIPTRFIELLNRPATNYWRVRHGKDWPWPPDAQFGPKCMLINGLAGSGGDMFPWLFKHNNIGKTIGTRTWGGLVGISGNPGLIDGGYVTVPTFGFYETDGTWGVEGHGVDPDIEVIDDPAKMIKGGDPQLDAAIDHMLGEIEKNGFHPPKRPESPNRKGMGIRPEDR